MKNLMLISAVALLMISNFVVSGCKSEEQKLRDVLAPKIEGIGSPPKLSYVKSPEAEGKLELLEARVDKEWWERVGMIVLKAKVKNVSPQHLIRARTAFRAAILPGWETSVHEINDLGPGEVRVFEIKAPYAGPRIGEIELVEFTFKDLLFRPGEAVSSSEQPSPALKATKPVSPSKPAPAPAPAPKPAPQPQEVPPQFLLKWGSKGTADGQFRQPADIAVDREGNVYVADTANRRIQKFSSSGVFITKWGSWWPGGVAVDAAGNVYVVDNDNWCIRKFTSSGVFITKWGSQGTGDGQFNGLPHAIAVDATGSVYVADSYNNRIQKFTSSGTFITKWGSRGSGDGQFADDVGDIAVDAAGNVYAVDSYNSRIQKFTSSGAFITKWGSRGTGDGQFNEPIGIAVDVAGNVYVVDNVNSRIQKFASSGAFVTKWGSRGTSDEQFNAPFGVAVSMSGRIYVSDGGKNCVHVFGRSPR